MNDRYEYLSNGIYWDILFKSKYIPLDRYEGLSNEKNCSDSFKN